MSPAEVLLHLDRAGSTPPHELLTAVICSLPGWTPQRLARELSDQPLRTLAAWLEAECQRLGAAPPELLAACFAKLHAALEQPPARPKRRPIHSVAAPASEVRTVIPSRILRDQIVGDQTLRAYYGGPPEMELARWHRDVVEAVAELPTLARARDHDPQAFEELVGRYQQRLLGFVRARTNDDAEADEVIQETWLKTWQKMPTFDPARGRFLSFAKTWAYYELLRSHERESGRTRFEVLLSEVEKHCANQGLEQELGDLIARLTHQMTPSADEEAVLAEEQEEALRRYDEFLDIVFSGASPPHQVLAFGFCKLLGWKPREVVRQLSHVDLATMAKRLESEYFTTWQTPAPHTRVYFRTFADNLHRKLGDLGVDRRTLDTYLDLTGREAGSTLLGDYYRQDPEADVSHWWDAVRRRIVSEYRRLHGEKATSEKTALRG